MDGKNFKRRVVSVILIAFMIMGILPFSAVNGVEFSGGNGTKENPYRVSTAEQLNAVRNDLDAYYVQTTDIDLSGYNNWVPIGLGTASMTAMPGYHLDTTYLPFNGKYDGAGYFIFNLTINTGDYDTVGLFGLCSEKSSISNINLRNVNIDVNKASTDYVAQWENKENGRAIYSVNVGGIAGKSDASIIKCNVSGYINVTNCNNAMVGGIVGQGGASQCVNYAKIDVLSNRDSRYKNDGDVYCGGITGKSISVNGEISKNINYGDVTATAGSTAWCGGISGQYGKIEYCINYGDIEGIVTDHHGWGTFGSNSNVGGIVGATSSDGNNNLVNMGNISAYAFGITNYNDTISSSAGGIVGHLGYYSSGNIEDCYNGAGNIVSYRHKFISGKQEIIDANAGRICGKHSGYNENPILEAYSVNTKTNGEMSSETMKKTGKDGQTVSIDFINAELDRIYAAIAPNEIDVFNNGNTDAGGDNHINDNRLIYGIDNFSFTNQSPFLRNYDIPWDYYTLLTKDMSNKVKKQIKDRIAENWNGTCYGMVAALILMKMDRLDYQRYDGNSPYELYTYNANNKAQIDEELNYLLNFYFLTQDLPDVRKYVKENNAALIRTKDKEMLEMLVEETKKVKNGGVPVGVCYYYAYYPVNSLIREKYGRHAIIAFDIDDIDTLDIETQKSIQSNTNGKKYKYRLEVYNPNIDNGRTNGYSENSYLYVSEDFSYWYYNSIDGIHDISDKNIMGVITNLDILDIINPQTNVNKTVLKDYDTSWFSLIYNEALDSVVVESENSGSATISFNSVSGNLNLIGPIASVYGSGINDEYLYYLDKDEIYKFTSNKNFVPDISMAFTNSLMSAMSSNANEIIFYPSGKISLAGEKSDYNLSLTFNEGYYTLPWYTIKAIGTNANTVSLEQTQNGVILTSNNLADVTIIGENDNKQDNLLFSTDKDSVLIKNDDNVLSVYIDSNSDGIYDTKISNINNTDEPAQYTITATSSVGGKISGGGTYDSGEQVTLTATPDTDYTFDGWYENGAKISGAGATYTFKVTANRNLEARFIYAPEEKPNGNTNNIAKLTDAAKYTEKGANTGASLAYAIGVLQQLGIAAGVSNVTDNNGNVIEYTFGGDSLVTRQQFALFTARIETALPNRFAVGSGANVASTSGFPDLVDSTYTFAIDYCAKEGFVLGRDNGNFDPLATIQFQEAVTMLTRALGYTGLVYPMGFITKASEGGFGIKEPIALIGEYADFPMDNVTLNTPITRAQMAMLLWNYLLSQKYELELVLNPVTNQMSQQRMAQPILKNFGIERTIGYITAVPNWRAELEVAYEGASKKLMGGGLSSQTDICISPRDGSANIATTMEKLGLGKYRSDPLALLGLKVTVYEDRRLNSPAKIEIPAIVQGKKFEIDIKNVSGAYNTASSGRIDSLSIPFPAIDGIMMDKEDFFAPGVANLYTFDDTAVLKGIKGAQNDADTIYFAQKAASKANYRLELVYNGEYANGTPEYFYIFTPY